MWFFVLFLVGERERERERERKREREKREERVNFVSKSPKFFLSFQFFPRDKKRRVWKKKYSKDDDDEEVRRSCVF